MSGALHRVPAGEKIQAARRPEGRVAGQTGRAVS